MNRILEIKLLRQSHQVIGIVIHLVAVPRLGGSPVPTPVVGDAAEAVRREEEHLRIPIIAAQRPTVAENNRLPRSPILEVNLCAIFGCDRAHSVLLLGKAPLAHTTERDGWTIVLDIAFAFRPGGWPPCPLGYVGTQSIGESDDAQIACPVANYQAAEKARKCPRGRTPTAAAPP